MWQDGRIRVYLPPCFVDIGGLFLRHLPETLFLRIAIFEECCLLLCKITVGLAWLDWLGLAWLGWLGLAGLAWLGFAWLLRV